MDSAREAPDRIGHRVVNVVAEGFGIPRAEGFGARGFELAAAHTGDAPPEDVILAAGVDADHGHMR
jgi:hypothetical protein